MMKTALQTVCGALALSLATLTVLPSSALAATPPSVCSRKRVSAEPLGRFWVPDFRFWRSVSVMGFTGSESAAVNRTERTPEESYTAFY